MGQSTEFRGTAVITGAGSGIGAAVVGAFDAAGCTKLALIDINTKGLQVTLKDAQTRSATAQLAKFEVYNCDVSDSTMVSKVFAKIIEDFGRVDYAVNCAGITTNNKPSTECSVEDFDRITAINM